MAHDTKSSGTGILVIIATALIPFIGGYFARGGVSPGTDSAEPGAAKIAKTTGTAGDSDQIPIGNSPILGNPDAPITIVEFSEFQCPFCTRGGNTMKEVIEKYPNDVKVVFKHNPLNFHKQANAASYASLAAHEQGKFWEMHDKLFEVQKSYKGKTDEQMFEMAAGLAQQIGMDVNKFKADLAANKSKYEAIVKQDLALGTKLGVRGTPHFFVNGQRVKGAQPANKFSEIIDAQLKEINSMLSAGTKKSDIYAAMVKKNFKAAEAPKPNKPQAQVVAHVPVTDADPVKLNENDALVTIVEFSDFQCPFCSRVNPTLAQIEKNFGKEVRIVFKQNPLPFHKEAPAAAEASLAANEQGKFWEMHDVLFENFKAFKGADMNELTTGYAEKIGLNVSKFKAAMESGKYKAKVKEDQALASKVGARGTPNFFVNGIQVVGAKPYNAFEDIIKKQIVIAKKIKADKNLSGEALYKAVVDHNKANAPKAPAAPAKPAAKVDPSKLKVNGSYVKGPKNAKVTIYEFSDFQCPYCKRGNDTITQLVKEYGDKINVVFKAFPLPFHKEAEPAHRAALAAGKQGKFWEFHDKMFEDPKAIKEGQPFLDRTAEELGLNVTKWKADMESPAIKKQAAQEMAEGKAVGVSGTPAFFVNGNRLVGAQPAAKFKELIDAELKK